MKRPTFKLRTRVGFYFLGLVATWTLFVLVLFGDFLSRTSRDLLRERGAELTRVLTMQSALLMYYEDMTSLSRLLEERTKPPSDVRYVMVLNNSGGVVWSTFDKGVPQALLRLPHSAPIGSDVKVQLIEAHGEQIYDYESSQAGIRLRLGMSVTPVQRFASELTTYILWIGVAGLLAVFAVALHVSRPVEALTVAVAKSAEAAGLRGLNPLDGTLETSALAGWFNDTLSRLEERTRQLGQSEKLAYLGEISTSIAHEINNPLGIIVLNAGFLAKRVSSGEIKPPVADEIQRLWTAAMRATLASQKLLQFSRYSTKGGAIRRRAASPEPFIRETVELLQDRIHLADCSVELDIPEGVRAVSLDHQAIQQVLFNLLTNALDASPSGGKVTVRVRADEDAFVLAVEDQGSGMSEEQIAHAKEPFFTTKSPGKGTGLGLAISDGIVRQHGGELILESVPERGTTATVRVPIGVAT
jgi:two-component system, NtrC family, sensor kinase